MAACNARGTWPLCPAACLFAAVKMRQAGVVGRLLAEGAPSQFVVSDLPPPDLVALRDSGVSPDGCGSMSPLVIAVRQQSRLMARLLLLHEASTQELVGGRPPLVHLCEALAPPAPSSSSGGASTSASSGGTVAGPSPSTMPSSILPLMNELEERLQLAWLLLRFWADPLQTAAVPPHHCFLTGEKGGAGSGGAGWLGCHDARLHNRGQHALSKLAMRRGVLCQVRQMRMPACLDGKQPACRHRPAPVAGATNRRPAPHTPAAACQEPAMLRLAVNFVRHQCQRGRQLTADQARLLVEAAARAFLGGF